MRTLNASSMPVNATGRFSSFVLPTILLLLLQLVTPFSSVRLRGAKAASPVNATAPHSSANPENAARLAKKLGQMPMTFEKNLGQTHKDVKFTARGKGYSLFLTPTEAVMTLQPAQSNRPLALRMKLAGANPDPVVTGLEPAGTVSNYYLGNDPSKFRTGVPHFTRVKYEQVYPGIDAVYYGNQRELEYDFLVAPGVDPNVIRMNFQGARKLSLADNGDLVLSIAGGAVRHHKPVIYQTIKGARQEVAGSFVLRGKQVSFAVGDYDRTKELVIDPTASLDYSTYLGGYDGDEKGYAIALGGCSDGACDAYLTGEVGSTGPYGFPDESISGGTSGGKDIFVSKLNANGTAISFYTFIGGDGDEWGTGIARNSSTGDLYVVGIMGTQDFDSGLNTAYEPDDPDLTYSDAFVAKLSSSTGAMAEFNFLGGNNIDEANGVALDGSGNVCVVGRTFSSDFPMSGTPYDSSSNGSSDVFVTKLNSSLTTLSYSTYLGGYNQDAGNAIAVDDENKLYITGRTHSSDFPTYSAFDSTICCTAPIDALVAKINPANGGSSDLVYSTFLGSNGREEGFGIAVGEDGEAFVTGQSLSAYADVDTYVHNTSTGLPISDNAHQGTSGGAGDAFLTRFNAAGTAILYSTFLGGSSEDWGYAVAIGSGADEVIAYITGDTDSSNFPIEDELQADNTNNKDAFVSKINTSLSSNTLIFSTYHAGENADSGRGIAVSGSVAYIIGFTNSESEDYSGAFPVASVSSTPYQDYRAGYYDCFAARFTP